MSDRDFINNLIKVYFSNAKEPHQATLDNAITNRLNDIVDKLDKYNEYKNLEEQEIGCPLDVLFKALKNGIYKYMWFDKDNPVFRHFDELTTDGEFLFYEYLNHDTYGQDEIGDVYLKDYKKTWWLKEDRSE